MHYLPVGSIIVADFVDGENRMEAVFIVGCGDVGRRVAALCRSAGATVVALSRSAQSAARLKALGIETRPGDLDDPASLQGLPLAGTRVFYFAPPPDRGETDPRMRAFPDVLTPSALPSRVVYISTTGVYGDCNGAWVTEDRPVNPQTARARRRFAAETALRAFSAASGVPVVVLRVSGIYGPGRLPVERLRQGVPLVREDQAPYSNRIHADDLARVCVAAAERGRPGAVYNVSDGHPTTMTDYFNRVADALRLPRPPTIDLEAARTRLSPSMLSFLGESRRIDNRKLREELGIELLYPDLDSGLAGC